MTESCGCVVLSYAMFACIFSAPVAVAYVCETEKSREEGTPTAGQ